MPNDPTTDVTLSRGGVVLSVPSDLESRAIEFVSLVEAGEDTQDALVKCNLSPQQAGYVLSRRPELQKRKESVRAALVEKRKVMVEAVEDRAYKQVMCDEEVETTEEEGLDKKGNVISKKKTRRKNVSHDILAIQLLGLDAEHRKVKQGDSGAGAATVSVSVQFTNIDLAAYQRGNTDAINGVVVDIVEEELKKEEPCQP